MTAKIEVHDFNLFYGKNQALHDLNFQLNEREVTAFIGPSGCGKSTFLRSINRMNDLIPNVKVRGQIKIDQQNVYDPHQDLVELRKHVGMVFQQPNPFPLSIYDNVVYGPRIHGISKKAELNEIVERTLKQANLWDEVKDRLDAPALGLSGGQQQRLVIARVLAIQPDIILMDEPASALDPISTERLEELIIQLKESYTIVIVTHNMQQAQRISDQTAFFLNGYVVEFAQTQRLFQQPTQQKTAEYIAGQFG
ncbi:phosphate ABC transporter ATP-binding protein, PhoT family [Seinonella peptonophila]|uniref:Phosphate ABC transporter ATP-binding protein, PhoT family n=1 Tax=Seinonella peptonophila TaxID=112248 RepID=A0A1M4U954_9BACL|nr:phosphate ABC transporter ATP-binding protein PstB [Seinonella peptonophila]SHE53166.1 phosphate ABC transporter ATP-binding protein, PhoT family [Seinonella peptonophila]